jgi:hypothetical protein
MSDTISRHVAMLSTEGHPELVLATGSPDPDNEQRDVAGGGPTIGRRCRSTRCRRGGLAASGDE